MLKKFQDAIARKNQADLQLQEATEAQEKAQHEFLQTRSLISKNFDSINRVFITEEKEKIFIHSFASMCAVCDGKFVGEKPVGIVKYKCGHCFHLKCVAPLSVYCRSCGRRSFE